MISNQILQNTIEGLKGITRIDFCVIDTDGKTLASTFADHKSFEEEVKLFVGSQAESQVVQEEQYIQETVYRFRNEKLLEDHYKKHGMEMGFDSAESYETAACEIINHPDSLHRIEEEDGDDVYYLEECNGFVIVSVDGYIRTFFYPDDGIDYFNRQ